MVYHINSKIIIVMLAILILVSCNDIMSTDPNIKKVILNMTPTDSLEQLIFKNIDFGDVKYASIHRDSLSIFNQINNDGIKIYNISNTNKSGLFTYTFSDGLPFNIMPLENANIRGKIVAKFYAQTLSFGEYFDTLTFNNNQKIKIVIRANVKSF